jgi:transposase
MGYISGMDTALVDPRQERGLALAKASASRIKQIVSNTYLVPSQTNASGGYVVDTDKGSCSCPDHELRGDTIKCKHRWAVEYARHRVVAPDGSTALVETMKITYGQPSWAAYNAAQCEEKDRVQVLLRSLCEAIPNPEQHGPGRRHLPLADVIYAATMRTFVGMSGRRATSDIRACARDGFIGHAPAYNTIFEYVLRPELSPLLSMLVRATAVPLASVETKFAIDGTGFGTAVFDRWYDEKYGKKRKEARFVKLHAICGVKTNVITAVAVTEGSLNDSPLLPQLVAETSENFTLDEVLADKGYIGRRNLQAVADVGATPYIAFKKNNVGQGPELWRRMWHLFAFHRPEFLEHYHLRSNVETAFSMVKRKFGGHVRARKPQSQFNEVLLKCLAHNLSVLVHEIHELGIEPTFWTKGTDNAAITKAVESVRRGER